MDLSQVMALSALAKALDDTFNEAEELLPQMIEACRAKKPLPRRNTLITSRVCAALSFVENGKPRFLILAHFHDGKISYEVEEVLVWIAIEAETCAALEDSVCGVKHERGLFGRFRDRSTLGSNKTIQTASIDILMRNTQSIAIRAAFLANFIRHSIERIARSSAETAFEDSEEAAQRHLESYLKQMERIIPNLVDKVAAVELLKSLSMPITPVIIAQIEDDACEKLNGIPMMKEHASAWRDYLGKLQGSARA